MRATQHGLLSPASAPARVRRQLCESPETWHQAFRLRNVREVFVSKRVEHDLFLDTNPKREQDSEGHQIRGPGDPIRHGQDLTNRVEQEGGVHRMADAAIDTLRNESVVLTYFKRDRPKPAKVRV